MRLYAWYISRNIYKVLGTKTEKFPLLSAPVNDIFIQLVIPGN